MNPDPILKQFETWTHEEGEAQVVRATPEMLRLKAELAREDARREVQRRLERAILASTVVATLLLGLTVPLPSFRALLGLGAILPCLAAASVLGFTFVWLMES